ncbi:MAG TPA: S49 family peptidase, partial [Gaiellaceae bacterium]|nr:S49 family peptidase [Gaiellaceae bacterium]
MNDHVAMRFATSRLYNQPLGVQLEKLNALLVGSGDRLGLDVSELRRTMSGEAPAATPRAAAAATQVPIGAATEPSNGGTIAVIQIFGSLVKRTTPMEAASSDLLPYSAIGAQFDAAMADPDVRGVLLQIDSCGGEVQGVFDLAARIAAADKTIWAIADENAYSAAYLIASAADRVYLTQMGGVGSIGVISIYVDQSAKDAKDGYKYEIVQAGERKADYTGHAPLSDEGRARMQSRVDTVNATFVDTIATNRGLDADTVRGMQANTFYGEDATRVRLADGIGTVETVLADMIATLQRGSAGSGIAARGTAMKDATTTTGKDSKPATEAAAGQGDAAKPAATRTEATAAEGDDGAKPAEAAKVVSIDEARSQAETAAATARLEQATASKETAASIRDWCRTNGMPELAGDLIA